MSEQKREVHCHVTIKVRGFMGGDVRSLHPASEAVISGAQKALHDYATANMAQDELCTFDWSAKLDIIKPQRESKTPRKRAATPTQEGE
jgi:hypothetical protein